MTDILDLIDQATTEPAARCWQCSGPVGSSVSDDFCSQDCQTAWHEDRAEPLVGYREPDDLPVHYSNEPELHDVAPPLFTSNRVVIPGSTQAFAVGPWSTRGGTIYDIPSRGRCLVTGPREASWDDTIHGAERVNEYLARDPAGNQIIVTDEFLEQACTQVPLDARFIGGPRHGETMPISAQAPDFLQLPVQVSPRRPGRGVEFEQVTYRRSHCDGQHWYYVADGSTEQRTIPATARHRELTIRLGDLDFASDRRLVHVSDGDATLSELLPTGLIEDQAALEAWFIGRRAAFMAQVEGDAYAEAERREPGLLDRRREALRPRAGDAVDTMPHEALYSYELASGWATRLSAPSEVRREAMALDAEQRLLNGALGRPWLPSPITPARPRPLLILAGNYLAARRTAEIDLGLNPRQWRHVGDAQQLHGQDGGHYYVSPTLFERRDADELLESVQTRRMTPVSLAELDTLRQS